MPEVSPTVGWDYICEAKSGIVRDAITGEDC